MMVEKSDDDSLSSEDEIFKDALKEATDHQFLKDIYFSEKKSNISKISERTNNYRTSAQITNATNTASLRKNLEQNDKFENFGVSPSFQNYVAKKLDEILEKTIKLKRKEDSCVNEKKHLDNGLGIKLLSSSIEFLTTEQESEKPIQRKKCRKTEDIAEDNANVLKCREVAVNPEWVLSKTDTKSWTSKKKVPEFKYKRLKNGTLIEQT